MDNIYIFDRFAYLGIAKEDKSQRANLLLFLLFIYLFFIFFLFLLYGL